MSAVPPPPVAAGDAVALPAPLMPKSPLERMRSRGKVRGTIGLLGPAFVAAIAYVDPGQLRHQHRGRRELRLPPALGDPRRQPDGDARAVPVGQGRGHDGQEPPRALPRGVPPSRHLGPVGPGRARGHGHRPRRARGRRDRAQPAVRHPAVPGRPHHRGGRVRHPRPPAARLPALRARHHRLSRGHPLRLPLRGAARRARTSSGVTERVRPRLRRHREHPARHGHPRRDRDAARDLPPLGAHPGPDRAARHDGEAHAAEVRSGSTWSSR